MNSSLQATLLDFSTIDRMGDISVAALCGLTADLQIHDRTSPSECAERIATADVLITNKVVIDKDLMAMAAHRLKLICVAATGTNNIDLATARDQGIAVCNVTGYATASVVQHVFCLISALQTHLLDYSASISQGAWQKSDQFCLLNYPIRDLDGLTLGIIGYGALGRAVGKVATAFGMKLLIAQRDNSDTRPGRVPLNHLLRESDIVTLHCPLTETTRNLIDARALSMMKPDSILINTARGGVVNETALADTLNAGRIGGAGLDVLSLEPPRDNPLLRPIPNLIVTPHIAWASRGARQRLIDEVTLNIQAFLKGESRNRMA